MEAGNRELKLKEVSFNKWSAVDAVKPDVELYVARISAYGLDTRMFLRPAGVTSKTAELRRVEHLKGGGPSAGARENGKKVESDPAPPQAQERRQSPGLLRSISRSRGRPAADRRRSTSRSYSRSYSRSRSGGGAGRRRSRSGSRRGAGRKKGAGTGARREGKSKGGGKGGDDGEEVTTIFVTGLPEDASEKEVREDFEDNGSHVERIVLMRRGNETNAFVRFKDVGEAKRELEKIQSSRGKICDRKVKAEMARRNTN